MGYLNISAEGDNVWPDLLEKRESIIHVTEGMHIAALSSGMESGKPSVAIRIDLPDGSVVIAETSMRLFLGAAEVFRARYQKEL